MANSERDRFSATCKQDTVLRLVRGEDLDLLARELGVSAPTLAGWRDAFLEGGLGSLRARLKEERDRRIDDLERKLGQVTMDNELLNAKFDALEAGVPLGRRPQFRAWLVRHPPRGDDIDTIGIFEDGDLERRLAALHAEVLDG